LCNPKFTDGHCFWLGSIFLALFPTIIEPDEDHQGRDDGVSWLTAIVSFDTM
jgi:hypothetical protein